MEQKARTVLDAKTKPQGSLGLLEDWAVRWVAITNVVPCAQSSTGTMQPSFAVCMLHVACHCIILKHSMCALQVLQLHYTSVDFAG